MSFWSWSCYFGHGRKNLVLFTSLVCTAERSFYKLKLTENRPGTSMTQGRLVNPAIMSIESDSLREIDFTAIISDFDVAKSRKVSGL